MEKTIKIIAITILTVFIMWIIALLISFGNMIIDHKCYMMDDETFYSSKMCQKYWRYR